MNPFSSLAGFFAGLFSALSMAFVSHPLPTAPVAPLGAPQAPAQALVAHGESDQDGGKGAAAVASAPVPQKPHAPAPVATQEASSAPAQSSSAAPAAAASSLPASGSAWQDTLPLGDGKYVTDAPKKGYIFVCHVAKGGEGAKGDPTWIHGTTCSPSEKVAVAGAVAWPAASYSMTIEGSTREIVANGLPTDHATGVFPIAASDPAHQFDANPNTITPQAYDFSLPAAPTALAAPGCIFGEVGIMNDGVALFDGFDAEYRDAVAHETQDEWQAHPDEGGVYHYHGFEGSYQADPVSQVVGFAFDGYPITGGRLPDGTYLASSDLDECHGITSPVMLDGATTTIYHYVLTQDFPYSVACFHGKSYEPEPGAAGQQGSATPEAGMDSTGGSGAKQEPPAAAIGACVGESAGSACTFATPSTTIAGACADTPDGVFACIPAK
ncbi:MAG TPA: YHYH protein [Candidatus Paceibacterota bacterium]|nr:YHYH protein [Candidatus Paceibacterota bacterium]